MAKPVTVLLRIQQERGCYGGAALPEPIKLDCGQGQFALGDWSQNDGLLSYSAVLGSENRHAPCRQASDPEPLRKLPRPLRSV